MRACNNPLGQAVRMSVTRLMEWLCRACLLRNWRSRDRTWAPDHFTASLRLLRRCLHQLASSSQRIHLLLRLLIPHLLASSSRCIWLERVTVRGTYCISQPRCTYMWPGSIWCSSYWNVAAQEHQDSVFAVLTFLGDILPIKSYQYYQYEISCDPLLSDYYVLLHCIWGHMTDKGDDVIYRAAQNFDFTDSF